MEEEVCKVIAKALDVDRVSLQDSMETVDGWDSLATLDVLMALENRYGAKVASITELAQVHSVAEIVALLKRESIIS